MKAIVTYHSIDTSGSVISVSPAAFRRHVLGFLAAGVRILSVDDLLVDASGDTDAIALTFDDGYASVGLQAAPLLKEHGLPATLFVVTDCVGATNRWTRNDGYGGEELPLLGWDALGRLAEGGLSIGSHTRTHPSLPALSRAQLDDEIGGAAQELSARLGRPARGFAYPYGRLSDPARTAVGRAHQWACTTAFRELTVDAPLELPRIDMWYFERPGILERWGTPWFRAWVRRRHRLRQARSAVFGR